MGTMRKILQKQPLLVLASVKQSRVLPGHREGQESDEQWSLTYRLGGRGMFGKIHVSQSSKGPVMEGTIFELPERFQRQVIKSFACKLPVIAIALCHAWQVA